MKDITALRSVPDIESVIHEVRGRKVILDADLARIYGVPTKRLNEQVRRNFKRFPADFMFKLTSEEAEAVRRSRSQFATLNRGQNIKYLPYAFTEPGAIMAANILNSPRAVRMSVFVVRAFVKMRELLGGNKELAQRLAKLETELKSRLDIHETAIVDVLQRIMLLLDPPPEPPVPEPPKRQIGFHARPGPPAANVAKGRKPFARRRAEYKAEEKALEEAKSARLASAIGYRRSAMAKPVKALKLES